MSCVLDIFYGICKFFKCDFDIVKYTPTVVTHENQFVKRRFCFFSDFSALPVDHTDPITCVTSCTSITKSCKKGHFCQFYR